MIPRRRLALAVAAAACLAPAGCVVMRPVPPPRGHDLPRMGMQAMTGSAVALIEPDRDATVELVVETHGLLVRPTVNETDVGWFVFDTGATAMTISRSGADAAGLEPVGVTSLQGMHVTTVFGGGALRLGPLTLRDARFTGMDLPGSHLIVGRAFTGYCGYDVLAAGVVELDAARGELAIRTSDASRPPPGGTSWQPLEIHMNLPHVRCRFEGGHEGLFVIDTGSDGGVWFFDHAVERFDLLAGRETRPRTVHNLGASNPVRHGRLAWFELGDARTTDVEADFSTRPMTLYPGPAETLGILGMALLRRYRIVFDYPQRRVAFVFVDP